MIKARSNQRCTFFLNPTFSDLCAIVHRQCSFIFACKHLPTSTKHLACDGFAIFLLSSWATNYVQESPWGQEASFEGRWDATGQSIPSAEYWGRLREMKMFLDKNSKQLQYQLIAIQKILKIDWKIVFPGVRRRPTCKACRRGSRA